MISKNKVINRSFLLHLQYRSQECSRQKKPGILGEQQGIGQTLRPQTKITIEEKQTIVRGTLWITREKSTLFIITSFTI